eukprot:TRINITY_DN6017_c0_g1_i9.p1 TRINITY_DN6017_c0_g1~~TRINITY_DN6017_c0_g1_i9.p1  ORF type:complete len:113 (+),score=43.84 TRINITY_DN6017_c0_g1_i9:46-339(+)
MLRSLVGSEMCIRDRLWRADEALITKRPKKMVRTMAMMVVAATRPMRTYRCSVGVRSAAKRRLVHAENHQSVVLRSPCAHSTNRTVRMNIPTPPPLT